MKLPVPKSTMHFPKQIFERAFSRNRPGVRSEGFASRIIGASLKNPTRTFWLEIESLSSPRVGSQFWPLARRSSRRKALTSFIDVGKSAAFVEAEVLR